MPKSATYTKRKKEQKERLLRLPPDLDATIVALAAALGESTTQTLIAVLKDGLTFRGMSRPTIQGKGQDGTSPTPPRTG